VISSCHAHFLFNFDVQDDETTLVEEEELAKTDSGSPMDEVKSKQSYFLSVNFEYPGLKVSGFFASLSLRFLSSLLIATMFLVFSLN
jgi:hypothetical protein